MSGIMKTYLTPFMILVLGLSMASGTAWGNLPNGMCFGTEQVMNPLGSDKTFKNKASDKYRFKDGKLYHSFEGRSEYYYGEVFRSPANPMQYLAGNMRFIISDLANYVVVADEFTLKIVSLYCYLSEK